MPRGPVGELVRVSQTQEAEPSQAAMSPAPETGRLAPA